MSVGCTNSANLQVYDDSKASNVHNDRMTGVLRRYSLHSDTLSPDSHAGAAVLLGASLPPTQRLSMRCVPQSLLGIVGSPSVANPETSAASTIYNTVRNSQPPDALMQSQSHNLIPQPSPSTPRAALSFAGDKLSSPACDRHDVAPAPTASVRHCRGRAPYVPMWSALTPIQYRGSCHMTAVTPPSLFLARKCTHCIKSLIRSVHLVDPLPDVCGLLRVRLQLR